ncbi:hypothetical protein GCM10017557_47700 [Streptomyces aurantiacus]|uniref:Uncharacterized protein n=1 Tax=Streptomyces aurantiacus TaxID=47760 RepID=A0A7G1P5D7_9ACTN|nr:hypothetical protein GCM10017557_47700 [Streptomyces aurantiacus]
MPAASVAPARIRVCASRTFAPFDGYVPDVAPVDDNPALRNEDIGEFGQFGEFGG